jgi:hypothetical protein
MSNIIPSHSIELHQSFEHLSVELHQPYDAPRGDQYPPPIRGETVKISSEENGLGLHFNMVKICCEANPKFFLAARGDVAELAHENPRDPHQIWIKDDKWGIEIQDASGYPAFSLVNKATKRALKHGDKRMDQIYLAHYNPYKAELSALWSLCPTFSPSDGKRYRAMRTVENIALNMDAKNGEVHEGTKLILYDWTVRSNQKWKLHLVH